MTAANGEYVGNAACAECHPPEFQAHRVSRHALTMRAADRQSLGPSLLPAGVVPLAGYAVEEQGGRFALTRDLPQRRSVPLHLALGSGKSGITFVSILEDRTLLETRMSYFPSLRLWNITPGQETPMPGDDVFGRANREDMARKCLSCHATTLPDNRLMPEPRFFGVGCEVCHGPGRAHIAAVRSGDVRNLHMANPGRLGSDQINALCGRYHRSTKDIDLGSPESTQTQRFQAHAIQQSRCRTRNGEVLSCLLCHAPHTDARTDKRSYEAVCLRCHAGSARRTASASFGTGSGRPCPVNGKSGCIACHMPPRKAFPSMHIDATMVDHLIAVPGRQP